MLTAMARELVTENGVGESAAATWRQIQAETSNALIPATITPECEPVVEDAPLPASLIAPALNVEAVVNALKFGSRPTIGAPAFTAKRDGGGCAVLAVLKLRCGPFIGRLRALRRGRRLSFRAASIQVLEVLQACAAADGVAR